MPLADDLCPLGFAPHSVRPTRCKRCFRDYNEHKSKSNNGKDEAKGKESEALGKSKVDTIKVDSTSSNDKNESTAVETSSIIRRRRERGNSTIEDAEDLALKNSRTRARPHSIAVIDESNSLAELPVSPKIQKSNSIKRSSSSASNEDHYENKERRHSRRIQILSAHEITPDVVSSDNSDECSADVAFILQVKETSRYHEGDEEDTISMAPTDTTETTLTFGDNLEDLQFQVQTLTTQLQTAEEKCEKLKNENKESQEKKYQEVDRQSLERTATELLKLQARLNEIEMRNEDLRDENRVLKLENKEIQEELDRRPSPEEVNRTVEELRQKLGVAESLYEELLDENEDFKREIRDLEDEIEELQDNFREDQADEYGVLKKELEQTAKNCRVLQFKLRKSEKRCDQLDLDKTQYEDKLKELIKSGNLDPNHSEKLKQMQQEVNLARETSNRMHSEMEALQNRLKQLQEEKDSLSKKRATETSSTSTSPTPTVTTTGPPVRVPSPVAMREPKPEFYSRSKDSLQVDPAQILRDLYDTMERENDLKEQLRFTEEEAENFRKKMSFLEQENETLASQIKKMATSAKRNKEGRRPPSREGNYDDDSGISDDTDELTPSELKLQLELNEQETSILRRKVEDLEVENISLQKEVRELQDKVDLKPTTSVFELPTRPPADPAQANIFYEQKLKLLENEAKELRMKIIDKDRENERLTSELMAKQRKGSKVMAMTRSRSLDSDMQIDLKRQLQLVEQEAAILRQKTNELENENDTLLAENKMLQLKAAKRGPLSPQEKLQAENMHLNEKIVKLEASLLEYKERMSASLVNLPSDTTGVENLRKQLKQQEQEMNSLQAKLKILTQENSRLSDEVKGFANVTDFQKRKKIPDLAPKQEFKKAVEELEGDVHKLSVAIQSKESQNKTLSTQLEERKKLLEALREENKASELKFKAQLEELKKKNEKLAKSLDEEKKNSEQIKQKDKFSQKEEIEKCKTQIEELRKSLEEEKMKNKASKGNIASTVRFEDLRKVEEEKHKLQKEILAFQLQLTDADKKISELEHTNKEAEKIQRNLRNEIEDVNLELERERKNLRKVDNRQTEVAMGWLKERDEMKKQITDLQKKIETLQKDLTSKEKQITEKEEKMFELNTKRDNQHTSLRQKEDELKHVKENNSKLKSKLKELEEKFTKVDKDMEELTQRWKKLDEQYKLDKDEWLKKHTEQEQQIKLETKKLTKMEDAHESVLRDRDEEVIRLRDKLRKLDLELKSKNLRSNDNNSDPELKNKVKALEEELTQEKQEYEDLTSKYEMLEEEHVITKAKLTMAKEDVEKKLIGAQEESNQLEGELKAVRETFNLRQDIWIKEKLDLQDKIKELDEKRLKNENVDVEEELEKLKQLVDEKNETIERQGREGDQMRDDVEKLRRQCQDLRSKLSEFDRNRLSGRFGSDLSPSSHKELQELNHNLQQAEIEELRTKLHQEEKVHRSEVTALKMMNDVKMAQMQDEIQMLHIQIGKFRRERDTYKEMLEGAQRTIGDLKSDNIRRRDSIIGQETEELRNKLQEMRKLVDKLQDQLDHSERANSQLKTEYITEKASWEIKVAEMQTKVNELEENTILQGGKSKIVGVRTKLELAWQKEREEQQRLLHESHRMAKELRQRVIDLENAKDKERTEAKRQLENLRQTVEADQAETQIKISELQADLLELRDAHSKMRTTNDRVKRERDKAERERDELKMRINQTQTDETSSITGLVAELEKMKSLVPVILEEKSTTLMPKKPSNANIEKIKEDFKTVLSKIAKATEELRRAHGIREEERVKRNLSFRRALSATDQELEAGSKPPIAPVRSRKDDPLSRWQNPQRVSNFPQTPPSMVISPPRPSSSLHRKSLSLDQSLTWEQIEQSIWKSDSDAGSLGSLQESTYERSQSSTGDYAPVNMSESGPSPLPRRRRRLQTSQTSLESISSAGSTEKLLPPRPPSPNTDIKKDNAPITMTLPKAVKDKRGSNTSESSAIGGTVRDRLKLFGKSKSTDSSDSIEKPDKPKDFKTKISNIFRKSPSRTSSIESDKGMGITPSTNPLSEKIKSLKPVTDPKNKTQYRSTGALHTKTGKTENNVAATLMSSPYSTLSLPRHLNVNSHVRSKSIDEKKPKNLFPHETEV